MHVVHKKAGRRASQEGQIQSYRRLSRLRPHAQQESHDGNQADTGAQAVHVVDQIQGIGDANDPDKRQKRVNGERLHPLKPETEEHEDRGHDDLGDQLRRRLQ